MERNYLQLVSKSVGMINEIAEISGSSEISERTSSDSGSEKENESGSNIDSENLKDTGKEEIENILLLMQTPLKISPFKVDIEIIERKRYFSPVEFNPAKHEYYFKKYASNYEGLKEGGVFKRK